MAPKSSKEIQEVEFSPETYRICELYQEVALWIQTLADYSKTEKREPALSINIIHLKKQQCRLPPC